MQKYMYEKKNWWIMDKNIMECMLHLYENIMKY